MPKQPTALAELSRTRLLLQLATLPDLAFETDGFDAPSPALQHVTGVIREALAVDTAGIVLRRRGRDAPTPAAGAGAAGAVARAAAPLLARVVENGEPLHLRAARDGGADPAAGQLLRRLAARALMAVPIAVDGERRGALYVADGARAFREDDLAFLAVVAGRVGLLLERAELTRAQREIDRQRAQAAARQELLGIVTHELKTPVAVLKAYAELLLGRAEAAGRAEDVDVLTRMEDQAERLLAMVEQVLDLQRIDAGLFPLEVGRVDLPALAERVLDGLRLTAGDARLRLEAESAVAVRGDRRRIEQVLTNLVQNAIRFSPAGGEVRVELARAATLPHAAADVVVPARHESDRRGPERGESGESGGQHPAGPADGPGGSDPGAAGGTGWAVVSVSDQGPGVAEQDRHRIFRRFYQGQGGDRLHRGHGGLGVGLYIAREIVERHGGALWLEPRPRAKDASTRGAGNAGEGAGGGATFSFALPEVGPDQE